MSESRVRTQRLLYGAMRLGGTRTAEPHRSADIDEAEAAINAALDCGITMFDLADIYRQGKSGTRSGSPPGAPPCPDGRRRADPPSDEFDASAHGPRRAGNCSGQPPDAASARRADGY
ncbi:hypothetical protein GCM10022225_72280 [Plantactinospora mayteni]|uniref:NADP-dependent oxidoreductase domain-containing protein n=1 Tax=Plantactinospora mayteni TaxID=566021 RepID=A0ABQ4F195_9ACTN|nr:aldo/keto reductase [Plantactinospora mayteni]GIH00682.1 hypothetical protein Pma05_72540 [Plantactinospora mayteni]